MPISNITISNTFGQFRQAFNDSANAINSLPASIVTNVGAISPVSSSGGSTPSIGLNSAYGDSQNPYASKTANHVLAAPNAASGFPSFRALVANDIPTILNAIATANVTANNLTSGRVAIVGASGIIQDDAGMTYNPTTDVLTLSGGTDASNAISGTLVVSGGVGIGKNLHISGNTFISGNLIVLGSNTELSTTQININDSLLQLANNNTSDLIDIGIFGQYNSGAANLHSGLFRDATDGIWKLFKSYSQEATTVIDPGANNFAYADLNVNSLTANSFVYLNNQNALRLGSANANYVGLRSSSAVGANVTWTLPSADGVMGQYLSTSGSGTLSWASTASVLPVANGGTNASTASITSFNNITGYTAAGATGTTSTNLVFSTSPTLVTPVLGTPTSGTLSNCTVDGTNPVGYLNIPQNAQTGNYTTVLGDAGKHIYHAAGAGAATYTIAANSSVAYSIGTVISFVNMSATSISIAITTDTLTWAQGGGTGTRTLAQYGVANCLKVTSTQWLLTGTNVT